MIRTTLVFILVLASGAGGALGGEDYPSLWDCSDPALQRQLEDILTSLGYRRAIAEKRLAVALVDVSDPHRPRVAAVNGDTTMYAANVQPGEKIEANIYDNSGLSGDQDVQLSADPSWEKTDMGWAIVPWGLRKLLEWISDRYDHPDIVITENGCAMPDEVVNGKVDDQRRIAYLEGYISACHEAIQNGVRLKGYFVWSMEKRVQESVDN